MGEYECLKCGEFTTGKFCSEQCELEYRYVNRTCTNCGGEFWNGGTSCTCEIWNDDENYDVDEAFGFMNE